MFFGCNLFTLFDSGFYGAYFILFVFYLEDLFELDMTAVFTTNRCTNYELLVVKNLVSS